MKFEGTRVKILQLSWAIAILLILLGLMLTNLVSAKIFNEELMWVTVCHSSVGDPAYDNGLWGLNGFDTCTACRRKCPAAQRPRNPLSYVRNAITGQPG